MVQNTCKEINEHDIELLEVCRTGYNEIYNQTRLIIILFVSVFAIM